MDYTELLRQSFIEENRFCGHEKSRLEYVAESIFDFTTYDSEISELFGEKAIEVCEALNNGKTSAFVDDPEKYRWYLLLANTSFFENKMEWGTSIRHAWWNYVITYQTSGLFLDGKQLHEPIKFNQAEWKKFMEAVISFSRA